MSIHIDTMCAYFVCGIISEQSFLVTQQHQIEYLPILQGPVIHLQG